MDRPSLPPIALPRKDNLCLDWADLEAISDVVARDVAKVLAAKFPNVALDKAIAEVSAGYTHARERLRQASTGPNALAARLAFFLPRDVVKSAELVRQAHALDALPKTRTWRILDLGAGLGTTSLGLVRYARAASLADTFEIVAVDEDARALAVLRDVIGAATDVDARVEIVHADIAKHLARGAGSFDFVVAGLALNELRENERTSVCEAMLARLSNDGLVMIVEPALATTTRDLMALRDALVTTGMAFPVFPCTHAAPCPMRASARDWCHVDVPIELDAHTAKLARTASLRAERPTFAGLVLSRAPLTSLSGTHRIVSAPLGSKGRTEIHACGDGTLVRIRQLDRHKSTVPVDIAGLRRGALVVIESGTSPQVVRRIVP